MNPFPHRSFRFASRTAPIPHCDLPCAAPFEFSQGKGFRLLSSLQAKPANSTTLIKAAP